MELTTPRDAVAANVRADMARMRINQVGLASFLGMSQQALSRRLTGEVPFDVDELHEVSAVLKTTAASLLAVPAGLAGTPETEPLEAAG